MTFTVTVGQIIFFVVFFFELAIFIRLLWDGFKEGEGMALIVGLWWGVFILATFFLYGGIYIW